MNHSLIFGHLLIVLAFHREWSWDSNFTQRFGHYVSQNWQRFFPTESECPHLIYVDLWPVANPVMFSLQAYISNQMVLGRNVPKSHMQGDFLGPITEGKDFNCTSDLEEWKIWRSRFNPGFSATNIQCWVSDVLEEVEIFSDGLRRRCGPGDEWGEVFPLEKPAHDLAFDVTGRVVLNVRLGSQTATPAPFSTAYREQLERMEITLNPIKVAWRSLPFFQRLIRQKRGELFDMLRPAITANTETHTTGIPTIIHTASKIHDQESLKSEDETSPAHSSPSFVHALFPHLMIFFFGGDDAIALVIPNMFRYLQDNPECLARLRAEHDTVFGTDANTAAAQIRGDPSKLSALPYTVGVIKETLRLSPATITIRQGQKDLNFEVQRSAAAGPWPSAGFDVLESTVTIHRDPANFPRPLEFLPERFVSPTLPKVNGKGNDSLGQSPTHAWRGFQLGPRRCIGQELAMLELKLVLVLVARKYDVELAWEAWDALRERQTGRKPVVSAVEGDRMYTTGKATAHSKDGAPVHVRLHGSR
ncbi:cytochrome P450 [Xylariaceae sp. FL1019]|nr:cytochrome P450 [Xylariaceae sp. FL1019]